MTTSPLPPGSTRRIPLGTGPTSGATYIEPPTYRAYVDRTDADDAEFTALLARVEQQPACDIAADVALQRVLDLADELDVSNTEPGEADTFENGMAAGEELAKQHAARRIRAAVANP